MSNTFIIKAQQMSISKACEEMFNDNIDILCDAELTFASFDAYWAVKQVTSSNFAADGLESNLQTLRGEKLHVGQVKPMFESPTVGNTSMNVLMKTTLEMAKLTLQ